MTKDTPIHKDKLGRELRVNDFVAFPQSNSLELGKVVKINPKMVKVLKLPKSKTDYNKYPQDCVRLDASDMTWFLLKNSG